MLRISFLVCIVGIQIILAPRSIADLAKEIESELIVESNSPKTFTPVTTWVAIESPNVRLRQDREKLVGKSLRIIRFLVYFINRTSAARKYIQDLNSIVAFDIEGERPFYFRFVTGRASLHVGRPENPNATLKADDNTFYDVMVGKIPQEEAFDNKLIKVEGEIVEAMRFRYITNLVLRSNKILTFFRSLFSSI